MNITEFKLKTTISGIVSGFQSLYFQHTATSLDSVDVTARPAKSFLQRSPVGFSLQSYSCGLCGTYHGKERHCLPDMMPRDSERGLLGFHNFYGPSYHSEDFNLDQFVGDYLGSDDVIVNRGSLCFSDSGRLPMIFIKFRLKVMDSMNSCNKWIDSLSQNQINILICFYLFALGSSVIVFSVIVSYFFDFLLGIIQ